MKRAEKAARISAILDELYPAPAIPLDHTDEFTLLVAVMLSAQTTDKKVNEVTPRLFAEVGKTPADIGAAPVEAIHERIRTVGLAPTKARNLKALSQLIVERHGGRVPGDMEALEELPGVGHKTASVVMTQWFKQPAFPVDTHIHRLAERWGLSSGRSVEQTEADLKKTFPEPSWDRVHLQIIYFGREHCPALRHDFAKCPICSFAASKTKATAARNGAAKKKQAARKPLQRPLAARPVKKKKKKKTTTTKEKGTRTRAQ